MSVAVVAGLLMAWLHAESREYGRIREREQIAAGIMAMAQLRRDADHLALAQWMQADPRWHCLAEVTANDDRLELGERVGSVPRFDLQSPPPEVIDAVERAQCWEMSAECWAAAAPVRDGQGRLRSLLYGELTAPAPIASAMLWWSLGALVAISALLSWYLVRRIYRPVEFLEQQARGALDGSEPDAVGPSSPETSALQSSITALASSYRTANASAAVPGTSSASAPASVTKEPA